MSLLEKIKTINEEVKSVRDELENISSYYTVPYSEMYQYYSIMKPKQAEKFIEGWVATQCGGKKIESKEVPEEYKQRDNGDIWVGETLRIGINNVELKSSFKSDNGIGGGQFRFYENVPYYLLFKAWDQNQYEVFLISKEQIIEEIISRSLETKKTITSSQGSGLISKMTVEQRIERLKKNLSGECQDLLGWGFSPKTEKEYYKKFQDKYGIEFKDVKQKINGV
jgi:hypothetical protein